MNQKVEVLKDDMPPSYRERQFTTTFWVDVHCVLGNMLTGFLDCHREHLAKQERKRTMVLSRASGLPTLLQTPSEGNFTRRKVDTFPVPA